MYTVITRDNCPYCVKAKEALSGASLAYQEYNVQHDKWMLTLIKQAGHKTVPQIYSPTGDYIGGYTELLETLK